MTTILIRAVSAALLLAACQSTAPDVARLTEPQAVQVRGAPPTDADPNACYAHDATPAQIKTVTEQTIDQPPEIAADGSEILAAVYKTETRQEIVEEGHDLWFETPCEDDLTPDFIASLQRALKVRGHYLGPVNGQQNGWTRRAIRAYQKPQGLDSAILSMASARQLGLVAYDIPESPGSEPEPEPQSETFPGPVDPSVLWQLEPRPHVAEDRIPAAAG